MKLSCSTRCIADYPLDQAFKAISEAGFRHLEASTYETGAVLDPAIIHTVALKDVLARHRLGISSLNLTPIAPAEPIDEEGAPEGLRREVVMGRELWQDVFNVSTGPADASSRDAVVDVLRRLADYANGLGLSLALSNVPKSHIATVDDVLRMLDDVARPNVGVLLDLVRFHLVEEAAPSVVERLGDQTLVVRTGDVAGGRWAPFGSGEIDNEAALGALADAGYVGFVVVEVHTTARAEVERRMAEAREAIDRLVAEPVSAPIVTPRIPSGNTPLPPTR